MPIRFKSVKINKIPGEPLGIKSVELPLGAGILVTGTTRPEASSVLGESNRIVGVNGHPVRNLKQMMEFVMGPPLEHATFLITLISQEPPGDEIPITLGEYRDFEVDEELYVTEVEEGCPLEEDDHIFMINNVEVKNRKELLAKVKGTKGELNLLIWRERLIQWEEALERREGFDYLAVELPYPEAPDRPKGYIVSFLQGLLMITRFVARSGSQKKLALLDRILFVNDISVTDMAQVREEITSAGERDGKYTLVIERPLTLKGYKEVIDFFKIHGPEKKVEATQYFDAEPASDMKSLARIAKEQRDLTPQPKPSYRHQRPNGPKKKCRIKSEHKSLMISQDTDPEKKLKPVKPRYS